MGSGCAGISKARDVVTIPSIGSTSKSQPSLHQMAITGSLDVTPFSSKLQKQQTLQTLSSAASGGSLRAADVSKGNSARTADTAAPPEGSPRHLSVGDGPQFGKTVSRATAWIVQAALDRCEGLPDGQAPDSPKSEEVYNADGSLAVAEEYIQAKFLRWDVDEDGVISRADLTAVLEPSNVSDADITKLMTTCDKDRKGFMDYDDFRRLFRGMPEDKLTSKSISIPGTPDQAGYFESETLLEYAGSKASIEVEGVKPGCFGMLVIGAENVPKMDWWSESDPYIVVEVSHKGGLRVAAARTFTVPRDRNPTWNQVLSLPCQLAHTGYAKQADLLPEEWDLDSTIVRFTLFDEDYFVDDFIGSCTMPLLELLERPVVRLMMWDKQGEATLGSAPPCMPCEIAVSIIPATLPRVWDKAHNILSQGVAPSEAHAYPYHVFMMTRGTRGDVQPFVALARGLAEQLGWLVTICTELRWKSFVKSNANVSRGKIRFRPSGGDTEHRMQSWVAQWAVQSKSELMQMTILASSECEFFSSATVFVRHILDSEHEPNPVNLLVFGLTVARVAALISELCEKPLAGFILQPSCIPSSDAEWPAVQPLPRSNTGKYVPIPKLQPNVTSHAALHKMKDKMEKNRFAKYNLHYLRRSFGLTIDDTYRNMRLKKVPLIIPMRQDTFVRPTDWWDTITLTDFIFLRRKVAPTGGISSGALGEPLDSFFTAAHAASAKVVLMTFSSMPVTKRNVLGSSVKMLEDCKFNMRLIYVGNKGEDTISQNLASRAQRLSDAHRFLEVQRADFGALFKMVDCFIVHGGLGTTVEALRMKKPCMVTGPLLLDQRFWGNVCYQKGVGPEPVHIDSFEHSCVGFVNGALDPADPNGWRANALSHDWGLESDDGVTRNVVEFRELTTRQVICCKSMQKEHGCLPHVEPSCGSLQSEILDES